MDHVAAFNLLKDMLVLLQTGDAAVGRADELDAIIFAHHVAFGGLYSPLQKPKIHFLKHVPSCFRRFGANMSCFGPERKHKELVGRSCGLEKARSLVLSVAPG